MLNTSIGGLISSVIGKSMTPRVVQFGWDGGVLYESLTRAFSSFKLDVVPDFGHSSEDEEGAPADVNFCSPDLIQNSPEKGHDFSVVDPEFKQLSLALYMSLEGIVAENGLIVVPGGEDTPRCRQLLYEMVQEGTIKCNSGTYSSVLIYEIHNGKMVEML